MNILTASNWSDYQLLDTGDSKRLEKFGEFTIVRPDPQIIWKPKLSKADWQKAIAIFDKDRRGKEGWQIKGNVPQKWLMRFGNLAFWAKLAPFKHTGVFPEQSIQWEWIMDKISGAQRPINVLNLFGYTGIASLAAAAKGATVTHVDASYPTIGWARENQAASHLEDKPIRWILDDAIKFTQREIKRGVKYDGIIMDPPIYGHGPKGEKWDFNKDFPLLLQNCMEILSDKPLFIIVNAYAISSSAIMLENVLQDFTQKIGGQIEVGELALQEEHSSRLLSTGIFARWSEKS